MAKLVPTTITYQNSGLVRDRAAFVLSDDAYQDLENVFVWRGRVRRRQGYQLLGRLRRDITEQAQSNADGTNDYNVADVLAAVRSAQASAALAKNSVVVRFDPGGGNETEFTDQGTALFTRSSGTAYDLYAPIAITAISEAASAVITIGTHTFITGNKVFIQSVVGMVEINDTVGTISGTTATTITVGINTSAFTAYDSGGTANGSFVNYDTGEVNLTFDTGSTPASGITVETDYGYYPSLPVMGLPNRELEDINAEQTVAFDTVYCYRYNNTSSLFEEMPSTTATTWSGADSDFFWGVNYWRSPTNAQYYWVTNFSGVSGDPMRMYDGVDWYTFAPTTSGTTEMHQCRMLIAYKGRLIALNTFEGTTLAASVHFPHRVRWSQVGAPVANVTPPTALEEWRSDIKGRGGFVDAPTNEHIVSAQFVRDVLIVAFERSTWALRYTGNPLLPFKWERINKELGSECTFSVVAFDEGVLNVGDRSINSCDGNHVKRIDQDIPDEVFKIHNSLAPGTQLSDGPLRVHGIRDFFEEIVYWTFPDASTAARYPDRLMVFNYKNGTWAIFTDSLTALGTYQRFNDVTWADLEGTDWGEANFGWSSAKLQSQFPNVIGGNQHGFVLTLNQTVANSESLQISNVVGGFAATRLTALFHNLQTGEFVRVHSIIGTGNLELNGRTFQVRRVDGNTLDLYEKPRVAITAITLAEQAVVSCPGHAFSVGQHFYIDSLLVGMTEMNLTNGLITNVVGSDVTIDIDSTLFTAYTAGGQIQNLDEVGAPAVSQARTYMGCGVLERVMGYSARSKKFNLLESGQKSFLAHIDFLTNVTAGGEVTCEIFADYNESDPVNWGDDSFFNTVFATQSTLFSGSGLSKEWQRFFCPLNAQFFEYNLTLSDRQLFTPAIADSDLLVDALILWGDSAGRLVN